jgi:AcrR family transcriptional regulator
MATQDINMDFRRRLLDGLAHSIREKGLQGTQVTDIVRNARTSRRTFYECFEDKEACFEELIDAWMRELLDAVEAVIDPEAPWGEQVDATVDAYLRALARDPALTVTFTRDLPTLGSRGVELQQDDIDRYANLIMDMTRGPAMRRAGVKPITLDIAVMLIGGIAELLERAIADGRPPESVGDTVKAVIKLVIGPR